VGDVGGAGCEVELEEGFVSCLYNGMFLFQRAKRTKRAFCRHVETSSGTCSEIVGLVSADCCQLRGGCASAMMCADTDCYGQVR
jgi:hypothetical protein